MTNTFYYWGNYSGLLHGRKDTRHGITGNLFSHFHEYTTYVGVCGIRVGGRMWCGQTRYQTFSLFFFFKLSKNFHREDLSQLKSGLLFLGQWKQISRRPVTKVELLSLFEFCMSLQTRYCTQNMSQYFPESSRSETPITTGWNQFVIGIQTALFYPTDTPHFVK